MGRLGSKWLFLIFISWVCGCANPLTQWSNVSSNEAVYEDAIKAANAGNWIVALENFARLTPEYLAQRPVRFNYSKTLAGRCGYDFFGFANDLSNANLGGATLMQFMMSAWGNKTILPEFCSESEAQLKLIWEDSTPTTTEQFFMTFLSMAKIGMYLRSKADVGENGGLGNGTVDGGFDSCDDADSPTTLTDDEVAEVITGLSLFLNNISSVGSALSGGITGAVGPMQAICDAMGVNNPCDKTDVEDVTADIITTMRNLLKFDGFGLTTACGMLPCCPP